MDLVPQARRALLTAYADTNAAIAAINVVDVDHYLLKPWEPPEEKLYPVVDELVGTWRREARPAEHKIKILGHPWSPASYEVRDFLARNLVPYRWYNVEEPDGARLLTAAGAEASQVPVVVTAAGEALVQPSLLDLANAVGLSTTPAGEFYDVVIIGGGPAGLGAAVYAASEGLRTVVVERAAAGGQAGQSSRIENYLGFPDGVAGDQLTERARRQALRFGAELLTARTVTGLAGQGIGPGGDLRRRHGDPIACGGAGHRGQLPPAGGLGRRRPGRPRGLLRLGRDPGAGVRGPARDHRGRGQLGRSGRGVLLPVRREGDHGRTRGLAGQVDVELSDRPDRRHREHRGPVEHLGAQVRRRRPAAVRHPGRPRRQSAGGRRGVPVRLHRRGPADRLADRRRWSGTAAASWSPGRS